MNGRNEGLDIERGKDGRKKGVKQRWKKIKKVVKEGKLVRE